MENRRILNWKNFSIIRRTQIIAGIIGAFVTITMNIPWGIDVGKYSPIADIGFQFWLILLKPTLAIWKAAGIEGRGGQLLFVAAETIINSFLCVIAGTLIAWIFQEVRKLIRSNRP
jgi:hypothetical protein